MCGRYASSRRAAELAERLAAKDETGGVEPDYNVAPTKAVPAVVHGDEGRRLVVLRWGLVPHWAKDRRIGSRLFNARAETAAKTPAFRSAFASRRCLLPADGYYEWQPVEGRKQPFFIHPSDGDVLVLAGLHASWQDPESGEWLRTCTVLTTDAPDHLGHIHDRTPMLVAEPVWDRWLDPEEADPLRLLRPGTPDTLVAEPVGTDVNNVRNNGPQLLEPVPLG